MTFWEGFYSLHTLFIMIYLGLSLLGILFIVWGIFNRKIKIDKSGVTFDRLRAKPHSRRKEDS